MAERRMFAKTIIFSDAFLDMPPTTRCLYFTLGMAADDEGFVNSPKSIMRQCGSSIDDLNLLLAKKFLLAFDNGVIVIKHWRIHNYIRKDMFHETKYKDEKSMLFLDENNAYSLHPCDEARDVLVTNVDTQVRLSKDKAKLELGKDIEQNAGAEWQPSGNQMATSVAISLILKAGGSYHISNEMVSELEELYPDVNVMNELRAMKGWCQANPAKRKTASGINRFIHSWLSREQHNAKPAEKSWMDIAQEIEDGR